jgi:hypothetical protein
LSNTPVSELSPSLLPAISDGRNSPAMTSTACPLNETAEVHLLSAAIVGGARWAITSPVVVRQRCRDGVVWPHIGPTAGRELREKPH